MKCTKNIGAIQDLSVATAVYSKEIFFYTDLYKQVNSAIRVPECYGVYFDEEDKNRLQVREYTSLPPPPSPLPFPLLPLLFPSLPPSHARSLGVM